MAQNIYKIFVKDTPNPDAEPIWAELELDNFDLQTIFSVEEIRDISTRKDNFTQAFVIKGTKKNNQVFGALYNIDRDTVVDGINMMYNYKPNKYLDCFVLENNVEILRGKMLITSIDVKGKQILYNCSIVGVVYTFFSELNDRELKELDYFATTLYNLLPTTKAEITNSWNANVQYGNQNLYVKKTSVTGVQWSDGTVNSASPYNTSLCSDWILVEGGASYSFQKQSNTSGSGDGYFRIGWYTDKKPEAMISRIAVNNSTSVDTTNYYTLTLPANAKWVRFSYTPGAAEYSVKMEKSNVPTLYSRNIKDYEPYVYPMIDYGGAMGDRVWQGGVFRWDVFRPAIYVGAYLDAIFNGWRPIQLDSTATTDEKEAAKINKNVTQFTGNPTRSNNGIYTAIGQPLNKYKWESTIKEKLWSLIIPHNETTFTRVLQTINEPFNGTATSWDGHGTSAQTLTKSQGVTYNGTAGRLRSTYTAGITPNTSTNETHIFQYGTKTVQIAGSTTNVYHTLTLTSEIKGDLQLNWNITTATLGTGYADITPVNGTTFDVYKLDFDGTNYTLDPSTSPIISGAVNRLGQSKNNTAPGIVMPAGVYAFVIDVRKDPAEFYVNGSSSHDSRIMNLILKQLDFIVTAPTSNNTAEQITVEVQWNEYTQLPAVIPTGIKVRDFLKNIMLMMNLFLMADPEDDTLFHIYTYNEFYENVLNINRDKALDWTKKADFGSYSIQSNIDLPRAYTYTYKEDKDLLNNLYKTTYNEVYGQKQLLNTSGLTDEKKIELIFSPTINYNWNNNMNVPAIYEGDQLLIGERKPMKSNLRILFYSGYQNVQPYTLCTSSGVNIPALSFDTYPVTSMIHYNRINEGSGLVGSGIIESLCFDYPQQEWSGRPSDIEAKGIYLYDNYHQKQLTELINSNVAFVEMDIALNEYDINTLDFRTPIYLQTPYGSAYFKLLSVTYNDSTQTSSCKLQKIVLPQTDKDAPSAYPFFDYTYVDSSQGYVFSDIIVMPHLDLGSYFITYEDVNISVNGGEWSTGITTVPIKTGDTLQLRFNITDDSSEDNTVWSLPLYNAGDTVIHTFWWYIVGVDFYDYQNIIDANINTTYVSNKARFQITGNGWRTDGWNYPGLLVRVNDGQWQNPADITFNAGDTVQLQYKTGYTFGTDYEFDLGFINDTTQDYWSEIWHITTADS